MNHPRIGGLFEGYSGLSMAAAEVFGGELAWYSEVDKGALKILGHRFPDVPNVGDVTTVDWSQVEPIDILTGGSPCQDLSHAGRRAGMTKGTRSNLWVAMREAIAQLRPSIVVWENVRGAYSAEAASTPSAPVVTKGRGANARRSVALGSGLLDLPDGRPTLRALGRVLGDLSDLGYDTRWHGLRAADVGAPHGRFRVFVVAVDSTVEGLQGSAGRRIQYGLPGAGRAGVDVNAAEDAGDRPARAELDGVRALRASDGQDVALAGGARQLLPTPRATDGTKGGPNERGSSGDLMLPSAVALLPTPCAQPSGNSPEDDLRKKPGRQVVTDLAVLVENDLIKSGGAIHVNAPEGRPREELPSVRNASDSQAVRQRQTRGSDGISQEELLLAELREHADESRAGHAALASEEAQGVNLSGLRDDEAAACSPRGPKPGEQRPGEPDDALRELSPQAALAGGSGEAAGREPLVDWGPYAAAIRRWEVILGRPAPPPTILSKKGNPQLCPEFVTWLMGLPAGWVTDAPGITRNEALKALGNGVVPQQAAHALRVMLNWGEVAA